MHNQLCRKTKTAVGKMAIIAHTIPMAWVALLFMITAQPAAAQVLQTYRDWSVGLDANGMCYAFATPSKSQGKYTRRGDIHFFASHYQPSNEQVQISVTMGYPINTEQRVLVIIDNDQQFEFEVYDEVPENAFAPTESEARIINAMRQGSTMVVKAQSRRGTDTTDSYSLLGFTRSLSRVANCEDS